jgi:hypothetical protein
MKSNVPLTFVCIIIDNWQHANFLPTNFAHLEPVLEKKFVSSNIEAEVEPKTCFFQQQVLLYSKHVFSE